MIRYVHTNIIAKDCEKLIEFYKEVFGCRSIGEKRDLCGAWLDKMTGIPGSHIVGEHLVMPGYENNHPTIEIFSYDQMEGNTWKVLMKGGGIIGELVHAEYEDGRKATFVYATDIEGNILELQSWE